MINPRFGRLISPDRSYEAKYPFMGLRLATPDRVEWGVARPPLVNHYNQGKSNACTAYSASWMMSMYNRPSIPPHHDGKRGYFKYDADWLYYHTRLSDGDPRNDPPNDFGSYVWAAFWVLNHKGHVRIIGDNTTDVPDLNDGIKSYYWCKTVDEMRTAFSLKRIVVVGINWYETFMNPITVNGEYWLARDFRNWLGGHAIVARRCSDKRQGFKLTGTWGPRYPDVWMSYFMMERLLNEEGEACVAIDDPRIT